MFETRARMANVAIKKMPRAIMTSMSVKAAGDEERRAWSVERGAWSVSGFIFGW